jgi:hypothetical protein
MRIKPLLTGCSALLLSTVINAGVHTPHIIIDKIVDTPIRPVGLAQAAVAHNYPTYIQVASIDVPTPTAAPDAPQPVVSPTVYHSNDFYQEYIFSHESGNILTRVNSIGCYGLGQSCGSALSDACPNWQTDLTCQLNYWNSYAASYGGWAASYNFWNCIGYCYSARINQFTTKTATWW